MGHGTLLYTIGHTLVGHSALLRDTLVGHSCRIFLWDTLVGHSSRTLLSTLLWNSLVVHSCPALLWDTLVGHSCGTLILWGTCRPLLPDTLMEHPVSDTLAELWAPMAAALVSSCGRRRTVANAETTSREQGSTPRHSGKRTIECSD